RLHETFSGIRFSAQYTPLAMMRRDVNHRKILLTTTNSHSVLPHRNLIPENVYWLPATARPAASTAPRRASGAAIASSRVGCADRARCKYGFGRAAAGLSSRTELVRASPGTTGTRGDAEGPRAGCGNGSGAERPSAWVTDKERLPRRRGAV